MEVMAIDFANDPAPNLGDEALVRCVLSGQREAFGHLYDKYAPLIRAVCYDTTRNVACAEDISQEAFLRAYRQLGTLRKADRFGAFLLAIARHACREWLRRYARQRKRTADVELEGIPQKTGDDSRQEREEKFARLHEQLLKLPDQQRLAIQICYLSGQPAERARSILNLSRSGLYAVLNRARKRLKHLMQSYLKESCDD